MTATDVAIVGAGPAGAWAAYRLARAGARVSLFDPSHPREKPCGGGVTGRALEVVEEALPRLGLRAVVASRATFELAGDGGTAGAPTADLGLPAFGLSPASGLVIASRAELDGALLGAAVAAGARLVAERVVDVSVTPGAAEVRTGAARHRAGFVLGADGAGSLVRRRLGRRFTRAQLSIATGFFVRGATSDEIVIAYVGDPPGYVWSFPRPDHLAVGIGAQADAGPTAAELRAFTRAWLERRRLAPGGRLEPYSWPIPTLGPRDFDAERPAGARWMLLGDAAGLVDPLTREGIHLALRSGDWAARALAGDHGGAGAAYEERLRDDAYPELRRAAQLRAGFFRPAFTRLLVEALAESRPIDAVMVDLVCGRQPYRGLRRRLLGTREWAYARRLLRLRLESAVARLGTVAATRRPPDAGARRAAS